MFHILFFKMKQDVRDKKKKKKLVVLAQAKVNI